jgi:hypothetical protein
MRNTPRLKNLPGLPVPMAGDSLSAITEAVMDLDTSVLAIQGPPGSGKTFVGSRVIKELVDKGMKVGVVANSHSAIENLLWACLEAGVSPDAMAKKTQAGGSAADLRGVSSDMNIVKGIESNNNVAATAAPSNSNTWLKYPAGAPVPPQINTIPAHTPSTPDKAAAPTGQYTVQGGGAKNIKVELKKKAITKKVHLNPKKGDAPKAHISKKHQTRKIRKFSIGTSSLHRRMTHAKKLHKKVKDMPIATLKAKLVKGGFIKENSKAPESILRQIDTDAEVVAKKAL